MLVFGLAILGVAIAIMMMQTFKREVPSVEPQIQSEPGQLLTISSPAFEPEGVIPTKYTCKGETFNPPLAIENPLTNVKTYVLIVHDPDATEKDWVHWLVWNIPPDTKLIAEHSVPVGSVEGTTDYDKPGYGAPCPPDGTGTHRYNFELYALNDTLNLDPTTTRDGLVAAMNGKVITRTKLVGIVTAVTPDQ